MMPIEPLGPVVIINNDYSPNALAEVEAVVQAVRQVDIEVDIVVLSPDMPRAPIDTYFPATGRGFQDLETFVKDFGRPSEGPIQVVVLGVRRFPGLSVLGGSGDYNESDMSNACLPLLDGACIAFAEMTEIFDMSTEQGAALFGDHWSTSATSKSIPSKGVIDGVTWKRPPVAEVDHFLRPQLFQANARAHQSAFLALLGNKALDIGDWLTMFSADEKTKDEKTRDEETKKDVVLFVLQDLQLALAQMQQSKATSIELSVLDVFKRVGEAPVLYSQSDIETLLDDARKAVWLYVEQTGDISSVLTASAILQIDPTTNPADEKLKKRITPRTLKQVIADLSVEASEERRIQALDYFQGLSPTNVQDMKNDDSLGRFDFDARAQEMLKTDPSGDVIWLSFLSLVRQHPKQERELTHKLLDRLVWTEDSVVQTTHAELCEQIITAIVSMQQVEQGAQFIRLLKAQMTNGDRSVQSRVGLFKAIGDIGGEEVYYDALMLLIRQMNHELVSGDKSAGGCSGKPTEPISSAVEVLKAIINAGGYTSTDERGLKRRMGNDDPDLKAFLAMRSAQTL